MNLDPSRFNKYLVSAAVFPAAFALGATACGSTESTCESPFKVSQEYPGGSKPDGLEINTIMPQAAEQLEVGFTDPGDNWHDEWLPAGDAAKVAMSIGSGAVRFRVRIKANKGSVACEAESSTSFVRKTYSTIVHEGATVPDPSKFRLDQHH